MANQPTFMEYAANLNGMFGNTPPPSAQSDLPFMQLGPGSGLAAMMFLQPLLSRAYGNVGMIPAQFQPMQSLYEQFRTKQYWESRQRAMREASVADRQTYVEMMRGLAQIGGAEFGVEQEAAANAMAGDISAMAPFFSMFAPGLMDQLHGLRGSALVMAGQVHDGGRFAVDPVTGRTGLSGVSAGRMTRDMMSMYFGSNADLSAMRGISAGRAGELYSELVRRGLSSRSIGTRDVAGQISQLTTSPEAVSEALQTMRREDPRRFSEVLQTAEQQTGRTFSNIDPDKQIEALSNVESAATAALHDIEAFNPTAFETMLRHFDARKVGERIKNLSGAVSAMRDIFGDSGHPNAPMSALLNGLQLLTQGGMSTMTPQEIERSVRMSYQVAQQTGIGLDALMGLTAQGAAMTDKFGLSRNFAPAGARSAAMFGQAFGEVGGNEIPVWGARDREQLTLNDQQLRLQAANSQVANQMAAALRANQVTPFAAGSTAAAYVQAVQNRETSFIDPRTGNEMATDMSRGQFLDMLTQSGMTADTAAAMLDQTQANQEYVFRENLQDFVRNQFQGPELAKTTIAQAYQEAAVAPISQQAAALGLSRTEGIQLSRIVGESAGVALLNAPAEVQRTPEARREFIANQMRATLIDRLTNARQDQIDTLVAAGDAPDIARQKVQQQVEAQVNARFTPEQFQRMSAIGYGNLEEEIRDNPALRHYETAQGLLSLQNPETLKRQQQDMQQAETEVMRRQALSGLGRAEPLRRLAEEIRNPHGNIAEAIASLTGGISERELHARLAPLEREANIARDRGSVADRMDLIALEHGGQIAESRLETMAEEQHLTTQQLLVSQNAALRQRATALHAAATTGGIRSVRASQTMREQAEALSRLEQEFTEADRIPDADTRRQTKREIAQRMQAVSQGGDKAQVVRQRMQQQLGLNDEQLDALMRDEDIGVDVTDRDRRVLRGLMSSERYGGVLTTAASGGFTTGAQLSGEHTREALRAEEASQAVQRQLAAGEITPDSVAGRAAIKTIAQSEKIRKSVLNVALGDVESFRQLGRDTQNVGDDGIRGVRAHQLLTEARALQEQQKDQARELGYTSVAEMLSKEPQNQKVQTIETKLREHTREIDRRMHLDPHQRERVSEQEIEAYKKRKAVDVRSVERSLAELQGVGVLSDELSPEQRQKLAASVESGGFEARRRFAEMAEARRALEEMATAETDKRGEHVSAADLIREASHRPWFGGKLADSERAKIQHLQQQAGELTRIGDVHDDKSYVGRSEQVLQSVLSDISRQSTESISGKPEQRDGTQRITGTVRLIDDGEHATLDLQPIRLEDTPVMVN